MNDRIKKGIVSFFEVVKLLQDESVITTKDYVKDVYKMMAKDIFGYEEVSLFSNNCPHKQPCRVSAKVDSDKVIIVLGPVSNLKVKKNDKEILFYEVTIEEIQKRGTIAKDHIILTKDFFGNKLPNKIYKLD